MKKKVVTVEISVQKESTRIFPGRRVLLLEFYTTTVSPHKLVRSSIIMVGHGGSKFRLVVICSVPVYNSTIPFADEIHLNKRILLNFFFFIMFGTLSLVL